jgi:hypothetical protein
LFRGRNRQLRVAVAYLQRTEQGQPHNRVPSGLPPNAVGSGRYQTNVCS